MQHIEIVIFLLGACVVMFIIANRSGLRRIPAWKTFISAFFALYISWVLTIFEDFFWRDFLNYLEHLGYAISSILLAVWCWQVFGVRRETR